MSQPVQGAFLALTSFAVYAVHDVVIKILGENYSPFQIIFFASLMSFPLMTVMLIRDRSDGSLVPRHPWWSLLRAICTVGTGAGAFYAFSTLPLAQTYAMLFTMPLLITLLAIPILGEQVGPRRGLAVVFGLCGVLVVLRPGGADLSLGHLTGITAALCGAMTSVIVRKVGQRERVAVLMLYPILASLIVTGGILPLVYKPMPIEHLFMMFIVASFGFIASLLTIAAYRAASAIIVAPMQYSQMLWAVFFGAILFNESPDLWTLVGAGIIIGSGIYIVWRESRPEVSKNHPVLENRSRPETSVLPRLSLLSRSWMQRSEK